MPEMIEYTFYDLPKFSLNQRYSSHWSEYHKYKEIYRMIIRPKIKKVTFKCEVMYAFEFRRYPLDNFNTVSMAKVIEDIIFPKDDPDIVVQSTLRSFKSPRPEEMKKKGVEMIVTLIIKPYEE